MTRHLETVVRATIAGVVIVLTFLMTYNQPSSKIPAPAGAAIEPRAEQDQREAPSTIPQEWQAIFVLVVGYYFSDRPKSDKLVRAQTAGNEKSSQLPATVDAKVELVVQGALCGLLILATVALFGIDYPLKSGLFRQSVAGAWIGGIGIAIAFFFKNTGTSLDSELLPPLRAALSILMIAGTLAIYLSRNHTPVELPIQWISLVFVVVTFYFKESQA